MKVVWLASWFPNSVSPLDGDFILRHAECASRYDDIFVIHAVKDNNLSKFTIRKEEIVYSPALRKVTYYYPSFLLFGKLIDKVISVFLYSFLHIRELRRYKKVNGKPSGIVVQVGMKAGLMALLFSRLYNWPYILFERWTGFLKEAKPSFYDWSITKQFFWKLIKKRAKCVIGVSAYFIGSINKIGSIRPTAIIPNAVKPDLFYYSTGRPQPSDDFVFIHISTLNWQKNFEDTLRAFALVLQNNPTCKMEVYGPETPTIAQLTEELNLSKAVYFRGETSHNNIARALQTAHCLILYSRFESFGNVIIEANACGLPVIVSDFPVFRELVKEGITGVCVPGCDPKVLAAQMSWIINNYASFSPEKISELTIETYDEKKIGKMFNQVCQNYFKQ